jgi:hypothetical protein
MPYVKGVTKRRQILPTPEEARNSDVTAGPGLAYIRWRARAQTTPYSRKRTGAVQLGMSALGQKRTSERDWFVSCNLLFSAAAMWVQNLQRLPRIQRQKKSQRWPLHSRFK